MSVEQINAVRYKCHCERPSCQHNWESDSIPDRCAKCKSPTWNRENYTLIRPGRGGKLLIAFGRSQTLATWSREFSIDRATIAARIEKGWAVEDAIKTPVRKKDPRTVDGLTIPQFLKQHPDSDVMIDEDGKVAGVRKIEEI